MKIGQKVKLGDLISVLTDYHANGSYEVLKKNVELLDDPSYALMIRTTNFEQDNFEDNKYINVNAYNFLKKSKVYPNDILMNKIANAGSVYLMPDLKRPVSLGMNLFLIRLNSDLVDPKYAYYYLKNNEKYIKLFANGAATSTITKEMVRRLDVFLPKISTQQKIAGIIADYNDLIDINRRRIQLLEESALLLFREWFAYFKFPNHKKVKIVDGVPEGWEREKIDKLVTFKRGVEPGSDNYLESYESGSYPFYRVSDLVSRNPSIFVDEQYAKKAFIKKSDIVVSLDGSVGIVSIGLEGCYSTGIRKLVIKDKKVNRAYLYFLMKSHYLQGVINAYAKGTTIQHAGEAIKHMNPILPPQILMNLFDGIVNPILNEILVLFEENQKLSHACNLLLPRLMSGAIVV